MSLSACARAKGHLTRLHVVSLARDWLERLEADRPDIVGFTATTGRHLWALNCMTRIKQKLPEVLTVLGGPHATYFPRVAEDPSLDVACVGEGEGAFLDLAEAVENGADSDEIPNLARLRNGEVLVNPVRPLIQDLDSLPFVDRELYHCFPVALAFQRHACIMMAGRGCPYDCAFCYNSACKKLYRGKGTYVRRRSPEHVVTEMQLLKDRYGIQRFLFDDDTFSADEAWLESFSDLARERVDAPFVCNVRADTLSDGTIAALSRAGCTGVKMGVETGDEDLRGKVLNKRISNEAILSVAGKLEAAGIELQTFSILGVPGSSLAQDLDTVRFNQKLCPRHAWCSLLNPYPGTKIRETAVEEGLLPESAALDDYARESYFVHTPMNLPDKRRILHLHHVFDVCVRHPSFFPLLIKLLGLPITPLYELFFKMHHASAIHRFYKIPWITWIRFLWSCRGIY